MPLDLSDLGPEIDDLMTHVVSIEVLTGPAQGDRGGPEDAYTVEREGVDCLILPEDSGEIVRAMHRESTVSITVLFNAAVVLGPTRRLVYDDPALGIRYFYPHEVVNVAESNVAWFADCEERPE